MNREYLHYIAMWIVVLGALMLFYLAIIWYIRGNILMSLGMFIMGLIALANFYLHRRMMKKKNKK